MKLSTYGSLWGHDAFFNTELIFGLGRGENNTFEMANYPVGVENGSSGNCPTQSLVDQYEYQDNGETFGQRYPGSINLNEVNPYEGLDPRFALTVVKNGDEWPSNGAQKKAIETFTGGFNAAPKYGATPTSYYLKKYVDGSCVTTADNQTTRRHTWIIFRLGEFYLDYAEAVNEAYNTAEAREQSLKYLNLIRKRAGVRQYTFENVNQMDEEYIHIDNTQEAVRNVVYMERRVELCCENNRWFDIRRLMLAESIPEMNGDCYGMNAQGRNQNEFFQRTPYQKRVWKREYYWMPIYINEYEKNPNLVEAPFWVTGEGSGEAGQ